VEVGRFEGLVSRIVSAEQVAALVGWLDLVARWAERIDLTAARDDAELVDLMVADAAELARVVGRDAHVVDVGSGAGAPGLPLALLRPDLRVTLVEPAQKRASLLRIASGPHAPRVAVHHGRGEDLRKRHFDVAVSRATLPPPEWLRLGAKLADEVWVMLAKIDAPQLNGWSSVTDHTYRWPLTDVERRLVAYRRS
jgi:16S rRNA (guanine527-N7)-methyltransferase